MLKPKPKPIFKDMKLKKISKADVSKEYNP